MKEREREGERERQDEAREERGEISFGPCCFLRRVSAPLFRFLDLLQHKQKPDQCFPSFLNEQKDSLPFWIWTCCVSLFFLVFTVSPLSLSLSPPLPAVPVPLLSCSPSPSLSLALSRYSVGSQVKETKLKKKNSKILPQNSKEKKNTTFFRSNSERPLLLLVVCRQGRRHRRRRGQRAVGRCVVCAGAARPLPPLTGLAHLPHRRAARGPGRSLRALGVAGSCFERCAAHTAAAVRLEPERVGRRA